MPASRVRAFRGPKTCRRVPFTVPKLTPMIVINCLRAQSMGKEDISQLRAVLSGFEPQCACEVKRWIGGGSFGLGGGLRERYSSPLVVLLEVSG